MFDCSPRWVTTRAPVLYPRAVGRPVRAVVGRHRRSVSGWRAPHLGHSPAESPSSPWPATSGCAPGGVGAGAPARVSLGARRAGACAPLGLIQRVSLARSAVGGRARGVLPAPVAPVHYSTQPAAVAAGAPQPSRRAVTSRSTNRRRRSAGASQSAPRSNRPHPAHIHS